MLTYARMDFVQLIVVLTVLGLLWYLVTSVIPLPQPVRVVATVVLVLLVCVWLLNWSGAWPHRMHLR